jgi:hypothetical protein
VDSSLRAEPLGRVQPSAADLRFGAPVPSAVLNGLTISGVLGGCSKRAPNRPFAGAAGAGRVTDGSRSDSGVRHGGVAGLGAGSDDAGVDAPTNSAVFDRFSLDEREGLVAKVAGGPVAVGAQDDGGGGASLTDGEAGDGEEEETEGG